MRRSITVLSLSALAAAALGLGGTATAAPADKASPPGATTSAEQRSQIRAYWTPARQAAARPAELLLADREAPRADGQPSAPQAPNAGGKGGKPSGGGTSGTSVTGATWTGRGTVVTTTGKVFFTTGGQNYVCSGSVVDSPNDNLVLTAGHCLHDGAGGEYVTNWAFAPAYDGNADNTNPYGLWVATSVKTTEQWEVAGDFDYDFGFATVSSPTSTGGDLEAVVGKQTIGFGLAKGLQVHAFGYPAASPYNGKTLTYCAGAASPDPYGATTQGVPCDMTGGSSGGPWYVNFDPTSGEGTTYSLNSYGYTRGKHSGKMFGPVFGDVAKALYEDVSVTP